MKLKTRKEMDAAYQWDLSPIFPDQAGGSGGVHAAAAQAVDAVGALAGTLGASSAQMKAGLDTIYETLQAVGGTRILVRVPPEKQRQRRCRVSAHGRHGDESVCGHEHKMCLCRTEILALPEETLRAYMEDPALASYRHILEDTNRARAHTLDEQGERLLAMLSDAAGTPDNCFTMLESVDMEFPVIRSEREKRCA